MLVNWTAPKHVFIVCGKTDLRKGIDGLPHQKKDICKMKIDDHKSNQEIADEMGLSINTVKSHYQEAIKMLRKYFKQIKLMFF